MSTNQNEDQDFRLETVKMDPRCIRYDSIDLRPEDFAFREESELRTEGETPLKQLSDDIKAQAGLNAPVLVKKLPDERHLLLDGHRRYFAIGMLIADGVRGFTRDMEVLANVILSEVSQLALVARSVSANVQREALSQEGRLRATIRLHRLGMPRKDIAQLFGISVSQVERDLTLAADEEMMAHVRDRHITATNVAGLMKPAADKNRLEEFKKAFGYWLTQVQEEIAVEARRREEADDKPLAEADRWPHRRLTSVQIAAWKEALDTGKPFGPPRFRYKAGIRPEKGLHRLEIAGLSRTVEEMSVEDLCRVTARVVDLVPQLRQELDKKIAAQKQEPDAANTGVAESPSLALLRELGLEGLLRLDEDQEPESDGPATAEDAGNPSRALGTAGSGA